MNTATALKLRAAPAKALAVFYRTAFTWNFDFDAAAVGQLRASTAQALAVSDRAAFAWNLDAATALNLHAAAAEALAVFDRASFATQDAIRFDVGDLQSAQRRRDRNGRCWFGSRIFRCLRTCAKQ